MSSEPAEASYTDDFEESKAHDPETSKEAAPATSQPTSSEAGVAAANFDSAAKIASPVASPRNKSAGNSSAEPAPAPASISVTATSSDATAPESNGAAASQESPTKATAESDFIAKVQREAKQFADPTPRPEIAVSSLLPTPFTFCTLQVQKGDNQDQVVAKLKKQNDQLRQQLKDFNKLLDATLARTRAEKKAKVWLCSAPFTHSHVQPRKPHVAEVQNQANESVVKQELNNAQKKMEIYKKANEVLRKQLNSSLNPEKVSQVSMWQRTSVERSSSQLTNQLAEAQLASHKVVEENRTLKAVSCVHKLSSKVCSQQLLRYQKDVDKSQGEHSTKELNSVVDENKSLKVRPANPSRTLTVGSFAGETEGVPESTQR